MIFPDYEVLGIGTPILDYSILVSQDYLASIPGDKGGGASIDYDSLLKIIADSGQTPLISTGGSTSNTIKGLVNLGRKCALFGKIGSDEAGEKFLQSIESLGVVPLLSQTTTPTAQVVCIITPDCERTCRSYLGAGLEMTADDLQPDMFNQAKLVHIEGYVLHYSGLAQRAMVLAKEAGAKISFNLASFEIVEQYSKNIIDMLANYVDILFANAAETKTLTHLEPKQGCKVLRDICDIAVVTMGELGCWVANGEEEVFQEAIVISTADTTGAGDLFASGFLHGYLAQKSLSECALYGAKVASVVVQHIGAEIPSEEWGKIKDSL